MSVLHDLRAEQAVLGAALDRPHVMGAITLSPEHFYDPTHAALWVELTQRYKAGVLIDAISVAEFADRTFGEIGGRDYLLQLLLSAAVLTDQAVGYAVMVRQLAKRRAIVAAAQEAIQLASVEGSDALETLEQRLREIGSRDGDGDAWERAGVNVVEAVERAELGEARGIATGFARLDECTGGMQRGTLWVVGAATGMGKSIMGAALSRNVAAAGYGVGEIHLEMDRLQIGLRTATALAFDLSHKASNPYYLSAQRGDLSEDQWAKMRGAAKAAAHLPIYVDARPGRTLSQIEASARRLFHTLQRSRIVPGAILIDHEGLIAPEAGSRFPSQLERANARSEALLAMAKRLDVCVVALSQITKEGARADGEERLPSAHDLAYGGAISQAASVVIMVHRKGYYAERKPLHLRSAEDEAAIRSRITTLVVDKVRGGRRAQVEILLDPPTAAVWEAA